MPDVKLLAQVLGALLPLITPVVPLWQALLGLGAASVEVAHRLGASIEKGTSPPTSTRGAADDPMVTFELTDQVRETIQQTLFQLLSQRGNAFLG